MEGYHTPLAAVFAGTITRMELEHDGTHDNIPAYNLPQNERGLVHITGRNDTPSAQRMGIAWSVRDPDGVVREAYQTWESWPYTDAGNEHEFIGGRFPFDKAGVWTIVVWLYMYPDFPTLVDSYVGDLCSVKVVVGPPEFQGFAINQYNKV